MKPMRLDSAKFGVRANLDALGDQRTDDIVLDAAIDGHNVHVSAAVRLGRTVPPSRAVLCGGNSVHNSGTTTKKSSIL